MLKSLSGMFFGTCFVKVLSLLDLIDTMTNGPFLG